jgi:hypothetical protein
VGFNLNTIYPILIPTVVCYDKRIKNVDNLKILKKIKIKK